MQDFRDKVAVVTGAGSGIGRALALQLGAAGARLALSDRDHAGLERTLAELPADCDRRGYTLDVSAREAVFAHAAEVERDFGAAQLLFNNAGVTVFGRFEDLSIEEIEWQLAVNLWGVVYGCKAFLPQMLARREGCIVNVSSVFGLIGFPQQGAYNVSKFGVRGLTECLWAELEGTGVRAVSVHPGGIATGIAASARHAAAAPPDASLASRASQMLVTPPAECARQILDGVRAGRRRILTGNRARTIDWIARLFPSSYPAVLRRLAGSALDGDRGHG